MIDAANTLPSRGRVGPKVRGGVTRRSRKRSRYGSDRRWWKLDRSAGFTPTSRFAAPPQEGGWSLTNDGKAFGLCAARHRHWRTADPLDVALEDAGGFCRVA